MTPMDIRVLLLQKRITQSAIAKSLKISCAVVCLVINGKAESRRVKTAIATALSLNVNDIWPTATPKTFTELDYVLAASERAGLDIVL